MDGSNRKSSLCKLESRCCFYIRFQLTNSIIMLILESIQIYVPVEDVVSGHWYLGMISVEDKLVYHFDCNFDGDRLTIEFLFFKTW